tara:strand:+ start:2899 stop:3156 length:258 start_codon:yes stop_codon:yes gene_type:complete
MIKKEKKSFSETKPFKRTTHLKTRIWNPFWLFKFKGLFYGIIMLSTGTLYFTWAQIKEGMIPYYSLIFVLPGIYVIIKHLKGKKT